MGSGDKEVGCTEWARCLAAAPFTTAVAAILVAAICLVFIKSGGRSRPRRKLPPSPRGSLPIIGHMHLLGKPPHQSLLQLANQYGGLMYLKMGSVGTMVVSTPAYAKEVLQTHDLVFASRPALKAAAVFGANLIWAPYGELWRSIRKICTVEIFTAKRMETLRPVRMLERDLLIGRILESGKERTAVNLKTMLTDCTFNTMARVLMSNSYSSGDDEAAKQAAKDFKDNLIEATKKAGNYHIADFYPSLGWLGLPLTIKMHMVLARMDHYVQTLLQQHKNNWKTGHQPKDFMDALLENGLKDDVIKSQIWDMAAAGMDTTATTVEWALAELIKHPQVMQLAQQELDQVVGKERTLQEDDISKLEYLQAVVKETLRLHPPAPLLLPHESMESCVIGEYFVPAKTRVIINAYAIGRDPSVWENPLQFEPGRFLCGTGASVDVSGQNYELLPFGSGRRICPGLKLGLTMVHFLLGTLVHGFDWCLAEGEEMDMSEELNIVAARKTPLMLIPSPRLAC